MGQIIGGVIVLIGAVIAIFVMLARGGSRRRTETLRQWAFRSGYNFTPGPVPASQLAPIREFESGGEVVESNARNVASRPRVTLFDFDHATRHEHGVMNNRTEYRRSVESCALYQLDEPLPRFSFNALSAADQNSLAGRMMAKAMGVIDGEGQIIAFDDRPGFLLFTDDDVARVKPLFAEPHFFDDKCGWSVRSTGSWLLLSTKTPAPAETYDAFAATAQKIYDHLRHSSS